MMENARPVHPILKAQLLRFAEEAAAATDTTDTEEPIRHLAQVMRAWCAENGHDFKLLEPEDFEEAAAHFYARAVSLEEAEENTSDKPDPAVMIWIGESAWKEGPWKKVSSKLVALYVADFIDEKVIRIAGKDGDVTVDTAPRKRLPAWVLAGDESTRKFWMDRVAVWIEEFQRDAWRDFGELADGSGEVPR